MIRTKLRGLTWDHPRAYRALDDLSRRDGTGDSTFGGPLPPVAWERQALAGFESASISALAAQYDLIVVDHPSLADAVEADALLPLNELFDSRWLTELSGSVVGPAYASYQYQDRQWALPIDVATQVSACRPDLFGDVAMPTTWQDVACLPSATRLAVCLGGPHALLMLLALCLAQGHVPCSDGTLADHDVLVVAIEAAAGLLARCDRTLAQQSPIAILDAMARGEVAYCPLIYGYVTYSEPPAEAVVFRDAPTWHPHSRPGSVLGGAGLAVSARCRDRQLAAAHLARLASVPVQTKQIPASGGQPSFRAAWLADDVNRSVHDFYRSTMRTVERAWVRPRRPGFVPFFDSASALVRQGLIGGVRAPRIAQQIHDAYSRFAEEKVT